MTEQYEVYVDDNFHYMDEDERFFLGAFDSHEKAVEACKGVVEESLRGQYTPGMAADKLYFMYASFGDDPFISGTKPEGESFSSRAYAAELSKEICEES